MGHSSINGNWMKFLQRLGVNSARLFVSPISNLRTFIGTSNWGKSLDGTSVNNKNDFYRSIAILRSTNGRNPSFAWSNPVKWTSIYDSIAKISQSIYGSDENSINQLKSLNINPLTVLDIKCSDLNFVTTDPGSSQYWAERWELYKYSYVLALWARRKRVEMIEFYNEPDLDLDTCLTSTKFKDFYLVRSLSIQQAYMDLNSEETYEWNRIQPKILASAFARRTFGGDSTKYLGELVVNNINEIFGQGK